MKECEVDEFERLVGHEIISKNEVSCLKVKDLRQECESLLEILWDLQS